MLLAQYFIFQSLTEYWVEPYVTEPQVFLYKRVIVIHVLYMRQRVLWRVEDVLIEVVQEAFRLPLQCGLESIHIVFLT